MVKNGLKFLLFGAAAVLVCWQLCRYYTAIDSRRPVRVACVGDSITSGSGASDKNSQSYPAQLAKILGKNWDVRNFGANDTCVVKKGEKPYSKKRAFKLARGFWANVVVINLGLNDAKEHNWAYKNDFVNDYTGLIRAFQRAPVRPKIFICYPTPVFDNTYSISGQILKQELVPLLQEVIKQTGVEPIDLSGALNGRKDLFPDGVHPNDQGYAVIAQTAYAAIRDLKRQP